VPERKVVRDGEGGGGAGVGFMTREGEKGVVDKRGGTGEAKIGVGKKTLAGCGRENLRQGRFT